MAYSLRLKAWRKSVVLHVFRNWESSVSALISDGSSIHQVGAKVKKAFFLVEVNRWLGISSRFASDERRVLRGVYGIIIYFIIYVFDFYNRLSP